MLVYLHAPEQRQVVVESAEGVGWRIAMKLKKQKEAERLQESERQALEQAEARFVGLPGWKKAILLEKDRKRELAEEPIRRAMRVQEEQERLFNSLPSWKQKLLIDRGNK